MQSLMKCAEDWQRRGPQLTAQDTECLKRGPTGGGCEAGAEQVTDSGMSSLCGTNAQNPNTAFVQIQSAPHHQTQIPLNKQATNCLFRRVYPPSKAPQPLYTRSATNTEAACNRVRSRCPCTGLHSPITFFWILGPTAPEMLCAAQPGQWSCLSTAATYCGNVVQSSIQLGMHAE